MHWYKFNIGDYRRDTVHLTTIEHGIYRQLLDWYYLDEQPIPTETKAVIRRLCLGSDLVDSLENVLKEFFILTEKGYEQRRVNAEIATYKANSEQYKNNGKLGGRPRKTKAVLENNQSVTKDEPKRKLTHEPSNPVTHKLNTANQPDGFGVFWDAYPKKVGKPAAAKAFRSAKINGHLTDVLADVEARAQSSDWQKESGAYIPYPATYLNQRRWEDEKSTVSMQIPGLM